jgi:hypothetical protein
MDVGFAVTTSPYAAANSHRPTAAMAPAAEAQMVDSNISRSGSLNR